MRLRRHSMHNFIFLSAYHTAGLLNKSSLLVSIQLGVMVIGQSDLEMVTSDNGSITVSQC